MNEYLEDLDTSVQEQDKKFSRNKDIDKLDLKQDNIDGENKREDKDNNSFANLLGDSLDEYVKSIRGTNAEKAYYKDSIYELNNDDWNVLTNNKEPIELVVKDNIVTLPDGTISKLSDGANITDVEVFAGKGSNSELRVKYHLESNYGGKAENWQHVKGRGFVETADGPRKAMLHWFQEETVGIVEMFVKGWSKK